MRGGRRIGCLVLAGLFVAPFSGCVSLDKYRRLEAANRNLKAAREQHMTELYDLKSGSGNLHSRLASCERELQVKGELVANLRQENELLDEMRHIAQAELEKTANNMNLSPIAIAGPKLPKQLDDALQRFASEHPSAVTYDAVRGTVKWTSDLLFALGSDVVKNTSFQALKAFTEVVKSAAADGFEVIVVGHTDNQPIKRATTRANHPTNWHLSAHRAISVAAQLQKNGYNPKRIGVMGCGEYRPVVPNSSEKNRGKNRRVEVYIIPTGSIVQATAQAGWRVEGEALAFARFSD